MRRRPAAERHLHGRRFPMRSTAATSGGRSDCTAACVPLPPAIIGASSSASTTSPINNTFASAMRKSTRTATSFPASQIPGARQLERFDPSHTTVCLPLGPGQTPAHEIWELVQLSTENHNFHIHQTRFAMTGSNGGVLQDNFPLGVAAPDVHRRTRSDPMSQPERRLHHPAMAQRSLRLDAASPWTFRSRARRVRLSLPHPRTRGRGHDGEDPGGARVQLSVFKRSGDRFALRKRVKQNLRGPALMQPEPSL